MRLMSGVRGRGVLGLVSAALLLTPREVVAADCTPVMVNKNCEVVIDREKPVTPLPIRVWSESAVKIRVPHRPFEEVKFDVSLVDTAPADVLGAVFGQLITPIRSFVGSARLVSATATPPPGPVNPADVEEALLEINTEQGKIEETLKTYKNDIRAHADDLRDFGRREANKWTVDEFRDFRRRFSCAVLGTAPFVTEACGATPDPLAKRRLPAGRLDVLDRLIKAALDMYTQLSPASRDLLAPRVDDVVTSQAALRASVAALTTARTALADAATILNDLKAEDLKTEVELTLGPFTTRTSRTATVKITTLDRITKATSNLATVTVHWGGTRWEISAGAIFSRLPSRKFENAQIIENGKPQLDSAGKINTRVTETDTRPMIVPVALVHFRVAEGMPSFQGQRFAFLVTGGVGVNPYSATADLVGGATFSYRGLMISALAHRTRDLRLTNGLKVGDELGSAPPALSTERFWDTTFALGVTYRIAIN